MEKTPENYKKLLEEMRVTRIINPGETDTGVYLTMLDEIGMTIVAKDFIVNPSQYPDNYPMAAPRADWLGATDSYPNISYARSIFQFIENEVDVVLIHKRGEVALPPYNRKITYSWPVPGYVVWKD